MRRSLACALALVLLAVACVTVEETHRRQLLPVPDSYMNQLGVSAYSEMKAKEKISHDPKLTQAMLDVGRRVAAATGKDFKWEFTLFENKEVNAWCLPGGKVGVFTGLLPVARTNAGLAAVLGHEIGHAIARHSGERMSQQLIVSGALISVDALMGDSTKKRLTMGALGLGAQFGVLLPFSRTQESEADALGLTYMARAGYDPAEAVELWNRMAKLGGSPPEILSDHPDPARRASALEGQLPKARGIYEKSQKVATAPLS